MDIYDDLERFKQKTQQNIHFQQFESSRNNELAAGGYAIFNQLNEHFAAQRISAQAEGSSQPVNSPAATNSVAAKEQSSVDAEAVEQTVGQTPDAAIFDSVARMSSKQSLQRLLHSAGLNDTRDGTFVPAPAMAGSN